MPEATCPRCGYQTLHLAGDILLCQTQACGYEHAVTRTMPIIVVQPATPEPPD